MSRFDELFEMVVPSLKKVGSESWIGAYWGKWKFDLRRYDGDLYVAKNVVRNSLQRMGVSEKEILEEVVSKRDYFFPQFYSGHIDRMEDSGIDEQKRFVLGLLSGLLTERLLKKDLNGNKNDLGVLVFDNSIIFGYCVTDFNAPLIKIPFYEGLGIEHDSNEQGLIFQMDFLENELFRFYPFYKCKNIG